MSEQQTEQPGTQTTTPPSVTPDPAPPIQAPTQTPPVETSPVAPGYLSGSDAKMTLTEAKELYGDTMCPYCNIGVRYVASFDPDATHEIGQPIYFPNQLSGGHVGVVCMSCGKGETFPLNPQDGPPRPPS